MTSLVYISKHKFAEYHTPSAHAKHGLWSFVGSRVAVRKHDSETNRVYRQTSLLQIPIIH